MSRVPCRSYRVEGFENFPSERAYLWHMHLVAVNRVVVDPAVGAPVAIVGAAARVATPGGAAAAGAATPAEAIVAAANRRAAISSTR